MNQTNAEDPDGRPSPVREEGERRFAEAEEPRQPGPLVPAEEPDRYVRTYRVRFEFHAVDVPGGVAASIAKDAAAAGMIKEPPMAAEAAEEPPAAAAPAAAGAPGPP